MRRFGFFGGSYGAILGLDKDTLRLLKNNVGAIHRRRATLPDAWARLVAPESRHACSFDAAALLPAFPKGYEVKKVDTAVLLDSEGKQHDGILDCKVSPPAGEQPSLVKIGVVDGMKAPWNSLRHLLLVLAVER